MLSCHVVKRWAIFCILFIGCTMTGTAHAQSDVPTDDGLEQAAKQSSNLYFPMVAVAPTIIEFPKATVQYCEPNAGIAYMTGRVRRNGIPVNGKRVVFSYEPDGPVVAETLSGPHIGYLDRPPGYFSHILYIGLPTERDWYFWVTDFQGQRISAIAYVHTDGRADTDSCQQGHINFDSFSGGDSLDFPMAGVQAHMVHVHQTNAVMGAMTSLDFYWVKQQVEWRVFEPAPRRRQFFMLDQLVEQSDKQGVNLLFSVVHAPGWAREEGYDPSIEGPPADPRTLADFLGAVADRYCNRSLRAIEIWNEQNLSAEWGGLPLSAADYVSLLTPSAQAVKEACPTMRVISGGLTPTGSVSGIAVDDYDYLEAMLQAGLLEHVDAVGVHASGYNVPPTATWDEACAAIQEHGNTFNGPCDDPHHSWSFRSTLEGHHAILEAHGAEETPLWVTEFGWAAGGAHEPGYAYADDNDYDEQAAWTVTAFEMMRDWPWVEAAFLWNLNFRVIAEGTQKAQWGIVDHQWEPLPAFVALVAAQGRDIERSRQLLSAAIAVDESIAPPSSTAQPVTIPEPLTIVLFGSGLLGLGAYLRRKRIGPR